MAMNFTQQEQQLAEAEKKIKEQEDLLNQYQTEAETVRQEDIPLRRFGSGVTKKYQAQYVQRREQAISYVEELKTNRIQIQQAKQEIGKEKEEIDAWKRAEKLAYQGAVDGSTGAIMSAYFNLKREGFSAQYKYYLELYSYYKNQSKGNRPDSEQYMVNPKYNYTPAYFTPADYYIPVPKPTKPTANTGWGYSQLDYVVYKGDWGKFDYLVPVGKEVSYNLPAEEKKGITYGKGIATMPPEAQGLDALRVKLGKVRETSDSELKKFFAGAGVSLIGTGQFLIELPRQPFIVPKTVYAVGKKFVSKEGFSEVGKAIKQDTSFSVGFVATEVAQLKAPTIIVKGSDITRTIRYEKIPEVEVIAPEYFKGQKYPLIKKGQTAQELLDEFTPRVTKLEGYTGKGVEIPKVKLKDLPFEVKQYGYTASSNPLKELRAREGSSEIPGVYQSPKLNPTFLRVAGEEGVMGIEIFPTFKPTAFKIFPKKIELIKGLDKNQKKFVNPNVARQFFAEQGELGKSYVPFIKAEKEAVIPADTLFKELPTKYYIDFKGRKIPIPEYEAISKINIPKDSKVKILTYDDIVKKYSSSGKVKGYKPINPYSISKSIASYSKTIVSKPFSGISSSGKVSGVSSSLASYSKTIVSKPFSGISSSGKVRVSKSIAVYSSTGRSYKYPPFPNTPFYPKVPTSFNKRVYGKRQDTDKLTNAYRTFIKVGGKKKYIGVLQEKGSALRYGEGVALRTLRATFGVEKTKQKIKALETKYKPSSKFFRDYQIRKGKKIGLQDTFIQRKGQRLATRSEVSELLTARYRR
jgi:hypothetical protein